LLAVPFDDIAPIVGRSPAAARQLASRARRRVQGVAPVLGAEISVRGATAVAARAITGLRSAQVSLPALINGAVGVIQAADGRPISLTAFTIAGAKIVAVDLTDDPGRIAEADVTILSR
jgi:hypothetical protein